MKRPLITEMIILLVFLGLAVSCAPAPTPTSVPPTATQVSPTATATLAPLTATPTTAARVAAPEPGEEWDLVVIGDSTAFGVAERYASHIENDLGVTVRVHDRAIPNLSAGRVLDWLKNDEDWRDLMREAEVVTFLANPEDSESEAHPLGFSNCVYNPRKPVDCPPGTFEVYKPHLGAIYEEILALRGGSPIIIRAMDYYVPNLSVWRKRAVEDECTRCWENFNEAIHQVAAEYNIPVAHVYDAFNGPNHDEDPRDKGYIGGDGIHTSILGRSVIADLFRELGYEYTVP